MPRASHLSTLDGWRGVATLLVICCHIHWPGPAALAVAPFGALGVHVFFALSGFLITTRILEEQSRFGRVSWRNFYIRRIFRILPPAFLFLGSLALLGFALRLVPLDMRQYTASVFLFRNYLVMPMEQSWYTGHFWSLAVEEHYYLLWPLLLWMFGLRRGWKVAVVLAVLIAVWRGLDERFDWVAAAHPLLRGEPGRTDYRLDGLLWGCVAAFVWAHPQGRAFVSKSAGAVLLVAAAVAACLIWRPTAYVAAIAFLMALLPLATVGNPAALASRILDTAGLSWVGRVSYSLYLWQQLFLPRHTVKMSIPLLQKLPLNLLLAFLTAWMSYRFVEQPAMAMGKAIQRRRRAVRTVVAHA